MGTEHARPLLALRALRLLVARPHSPLELGEQLGLSRRAVARLVAALEADGVEVEREQGETGRHVLLTVSRAAALRALGLK